MLVLANTDANSWEKRVYIFAGMQAIVFTAVGWLFGREVNLSAAKAAAADAQEAKSEAASARTEAAGLREELGGAKDAAATERSKGVAARAAVEAYIASKAEPRALATGPRDAGPDVGRPNDLAAIKKLLDDIYGSSA